MTCCRLKHPNNQPCDQQSLVPTLMGLYFDMYYKLVADRLPDKSRPAWDLISNQRDRVFPKKFAYVAESGTITQRKLFGDMLDRVENFATKEQDAAMRFTSRRSRY